MIDIVFRPEAFKHFLGLHKLTEVGNKKMNSERLYFMFGKDFSKNKLQQNKIFNSYIKHEKFSSIRTRLFLISNLHKLLTTHATKIKYYKFKTQVSGRNVGYDYVFKWDSNRLFLENSIITDDIFFFITIDKNSIVPYLYTPVSIFDFPGDYTAGKQLEMFGLLTEEFKLMSQFIESDKFKMKLKEVHKTY